MQILLAIDDEGGRAELTQLLKEDGHDVAHAHGEAEAVRLASAWRAQLLVIGAASPGALRRLQEEGLPQGIAVCALIAADAPERDANVTALRQPVDRDALRAVLATVGRGQVPGGKAPDAPRPHATHLPLMDRPLLDELAESLGPEDFGQVIEVFLAEMPPLIARLEDAVSRGDVIATFAAAHEGVGIAATLGMPRLAEIMRQLESASRSGRPEALPALLDDSRLIWEETAYAIDLLSGD